MRIKETTIRWVGIPLLAILSMYLMEGHQEQYQPWFWGFFVSLIYTSVFWNGAVLIFYAWRRQFPDIRDTPKKIILTLLSLTIFISLGSVILDSVFQPGSGNFFSLEDFMNGIPFSFLASFFIGTIYEASYFFENWKESFRQNEELKNQQIRTQFEVLQNQMSPHFLFNSLNTLTTLIAENPELAIDFTQNLSEVYRYILKQKDRELVVLSEEIEFSKAYLSLLKIRYPENLQVKIEVNPQSETLFIPPLTIQMLIENAIKHNVISKMKPLFIEISSPNSETILVKNNLQIKNSLERSTKTGLENIRKRYALLNKPGIDIIKTAQNYIVAVPLIQVNKVEDYQLETATA
ncbi:histidine kinase [uncultured Algoriphagus sp.]|jgi:Putative regulator of cell autolysis|uniref:sensor histidine kinase n=1 Tax=uncultured Algoriphagus sp. TaxID=417365 RepID=UPI00106627F1|nr:histidine kinase [uncultured Algoriphagus sp.]